MSLISTIEFESLSLQTQIGTFADGQTDPYSHSLDLMIVVDSSLVLIDEDDMQRVFDYDPLLEQIHTLAQERVYETQEMLLTRILACCSAYAAIQGVELCLKKTRQDPGQGASHATIGVRLLVSGQELDALR